MKVHKRWKVTSGPASEPVSRTEAKNFLRVTNSKEDDLIDSIIKAARRKAEDFTGKKFIDQEITMFMDSFPGTEKTPWWVGEKIGHIDTLNAPSRIIQLPIGPAQSGIVISTFDDSDSESTYDSSNYIEDTTDPRGRVILKEGQTWPTDLRPANAVKVVYTAGYGSSASDVPDDIKQAIKMMAAHFYENREAEIMKTSSRLKIGFQNILMPYKEVSL